MQYGVCPLHTMLHPPQLFLSVAEFVSQPFDPRLSQFLNAPLHANAHMPPMQEAVPLMLLHFVPQPPQLFTVSIAVSQPFWALPSQLMKPMAQVGTQTEPTQAVAPFAFVHFLLHAPQLFSSIERSKHCWPQHEKPAAHGFVSLQPSTHVSPTRR